MISHPSISDPRLCIVGAGRLSTNRIFPYLGAAGAQLVGVCDLDQEKAIRSTRRFGGAAYSNYKEMLAEQKPDGVIVCVGPKLHAMLAIEIMRSGYPVYTEKPPAESAGEALIVARVAKETGLLCTTAFKKRYSRCYSRAKEWIHKFSPEDLLSLSIEYCSGHYENGTPLSTFLLDFAIHAIDLTLFLFGDVEALFAFTREHHAYGVSLRFANGALGTLNLNDGRAWDIPTEEVEITVKGGNFMTVHNSSTWRITENQKAVEWREPPTYISQGDSGRETGHLAEIEDFVSALKEKRTTTRSSIYDSYKSMVLHDAIRTSAETGQITKPVYESI
jgi:UDP-N-acetylglucosamine 3-dehydrogenase